MVFCFDLVSDIVVFCCSQSVRWLCVLTWLMIQVFTVAHKVCDCFVFYLVSDVIVCCCSQSV